MKRPRPDLANDLILPAIGTVLLFLGWWYGWLSADLIHEILFHE